MGDGGLDISLQVAHISLSLILALIKTAPPPSSSPPTPPPPPAKKKQTQYNKQHNNNNKKHRHAITQICRIRASPPATTHRNLEFVI